MGKRIFAALVFTAALGCGFNNNRIPADAVVVRNGTVIDGTGAPSIADGVVVIQGERIVAVGPVSAFHIPRDARIVHAAGGTILPGVINSHTHSTHDASVRRAFLVDGVTSTCNLGTTLERLELFEDESAPEGPAGRGFWAGPIITAPGGYPGSVFGSQFNYEVGTPKEARAAVRDLLDRGAGMIKIALAPGDPNDPWPTLDLERVQAIVEEAHARGTPVRAHVFEPYLVEDIVLPAGVDVIEHEPFPILTPDEENRILGSDNPLPLLFEEVAPEYDTLLERIVAQGIVMVPTLDQQVGTMFTNPDRSPIEQIVVDVHVEAARRFHALGGVMALGNDFGGVPHVQPGMPLVEMKLLAASGLTPLEVIEASTSHAATVCGQKDNLGTLEPGKLADVIIVSGDPLTDLTAMDSVIAVIKSGELAYLHPDLPTP